MCLSNFKAKRQFKVPISWLRYFTRSYEKTFFGYWDGALDSVWRFSITHCTSIVNVRIIITSFETDAVSDNRQLDSWFNNSFRLISKKKQSHILVPLWGQTIGNYWFPHDGPAMLNAFLYQGVIKGGMLKSYFHISCFLHVVLDNIHTLCVIAHKTLSLYSDEYVL